MIDDLLNSVVLVLKIDVKEVFVEMNQELP